MSTRSELGGEGGRGEIDGIGLEEKVPGNPDERGQGEEPGRTGDEGDTAVAVPTPSP